MTAKLDRRLLLERRSTDADSAGDGSASAYSPTRFPPRRSMAVGEGTGEAAAARATHQD
jgi:hypothetical protein